MSKLMIFGRSRYDSMIVMVSRPSDKFVDLYFYNQLYIALLTFDLEWTDSDSAWFNCWSNPIDILKRFIYKGR